MREVLAYGGALVAASVFVGMIKLLGLLRRSSRVFEISRQSLDDLRNPELDDDAKEVRMRRNSLLLARLSVVLTLGLMLAMAAPIPVLWLTDRIGIVSIHEVERASLSWQFFALLAVFVFGKLGYDRRARRGAE